MTDLKLDKMSECILTIFSERRRLSVHDLAFLTQLPMESLAPYMIELWDQGYIKSPDMPPQNTLSTSQSFTITPKGDLYFQEKDRQARELRETRLWKLAPIIISIVALIVAIASFYISYLSYTSKL